MADKEVKYVIRYVVDESKAIRGLDAIDARMLRSIAVAEKLKATLKGVGSDMSGLAAYSKGLQGLDGSFRATGVAAGMAEQELKTVGKGNSSLTSYDKRLQKLIASLQAAATAGTAASASLAGVGKGGPSGGGGGGGGAGPRRAMVLGMAAGATMAGLRKAGSIVGAGIGDRKAYLDQAADMASEYRKNLTELAVLKGKVAPDDELIRSDLAFQKSALMDPDQSRTFRLEFGGAISPALKSRDKAGNPNITQGTADKLETEAARFTARYGLDATTGGRMAGLIGVTQKIPTAAAGVAIMAESMEQLNVEGVGPVKDMAKHLLSLSGGMLESGGAENEDGQGGGGGRFKSFQEMAARYAASTVAQAGSAARAKTRIVQSDRLLRKFAVDSKSALGLAAKITPEDDYETAIRKLAPHIAGPGGDQKLIESGYKNSTERLAIIEEAKMNGIVDQSIADPRKKAMAARAIQDNDRYAGSTAARQQQGENAEFTSAIETGLIGERMKAARAAARARMADPNQPGGQRLKAGLFGSLTDAAGSYMTSLGGISGEDLRVDREAMAGLIEGGRKAGVDVRKLAPTAAHRMDAGMALDDDASRKEFNAAYQAVESAGGDPLGGAPKDAARALRDAANALDAMGRPRQGGSGPPMPPPPGGGAGFTPARR